MTLLVIGGTGTLGRQIVREALENGFQVRCIVRNKNNAKFLGEWGAELVYGDLTIPETLPLAFQGVTAVIDASTTRPQDDEDMISVDLYSKLLLIEIAKRVNVKRFIFFSILKAENYPNITLMKQKADIERVLENSGVPYTIFRCAGFYQAVINQYAIPILEGKSVWKTFESVPTSYIDTQDAAKFCIKSLVIPETVNKSFFLGGPKAWVSDEIISRCEALSGQIANVQIIPIFLLKVIRFITSLFEWSSKVSERLAFIEVLEEGQELTLSVKNVYDIFNIKAEELSGLDLYLKEYFEMMLLVLEKVDLENQKRQKNLIL